jgi:hypothetical protein
MSYTDDESERRQFLAIFQTIGMQAMELPREQRLAFIHRAVTAIYRDYERKKEADPTTAEMAERLEKMSAALVRMIEESGGSVGHA